MVIASRDLLLSVVQVPKLVETFIILFVPVASTMCCFASSLRVLSPLPSPLVVDESTWPTPISMLHRANDEAIACKL